MEEDRLLYRRWLEGDETAFSEILLRYREGLTWYLCGLVRHPETAEDLAEDVFAELIVHPHRYNGSASLKTYLYRIGHHKAVSLLRRSRFRAVPLTEAEQHADWRSPEEHVLQNEQNRRLYAALQTLPSHYRQALYLCTIEGMSHAQAAQVMGRSVRQIDNDVYRGRQMLRQQLGQEEAE